jgi:putative transposase
LKPNNRQQTHCRKHAGCARFAYNRGLGRKIEEYKRTGKAPNAFDLHKELNHLKKTQFSWMYEVSKCAPQIALLNLDKAFKHFFRRLRKGENPGFPKFKSRKQGNQSFRLTGVIRVFKESIQLPRLGRLRLKEKGYLPSESERVHNLSATVSEKAGRWFVSLQVQEEMEITENKGKIVGVDFGINNLLTVSDGTVVENPKALNRYERKLNRVQRSLSRKQTRSKNREKVRRSLQRLYSRITNIRKDTFHKATTKLAKTKSIVVIEDLNVEGMRKNHRLAKSLSDASFSELRRQLQYKTHWYGSQLKVAPSFFPSTKRCSQCGQIKNELHLSMRIYTCESCDLKIDRDLNASHNLAQVAASWAETENACREAGGYRPVRSVPVNDAGTKHYLKMLDR